MLDELENKNIEKCFEKMVNILKDDDVTFPVIADFLDENYEILQIFLNVKTFSINDRFKNHAEYRCYLKNQIKINDAWLMIDEEKKIDETKIVPDLEKSKKFIWIVW